ncbi:hypothetical protein HFN87_25545 [Rhizobium laguerreae]|uniref:hypothetical protein n=1 Tax=Rhizobium laguerreae TaxID=1076926 RepID=UPI001C92B6B4|nr:hypothetical protein [Rhizobium laguerreae]MBY3416635.1 hypothetical protein [Rhizobium laguerreae]
MMEMLLSLRSEGYLGKAQVFPGENRAYPAVPHFAEKTAFALLLELLSSVSINQRRLQLSLANYGARLQILMSYAPILSLFVTKHQTIKCPGKNHVRRVS